MQVPKRRKQTCYGNEHIGYKHAPDCRRGRPQCAAMRKTNPKRKPCGCDAYHYPHRYGSGRCCNPFRQIMDEVPDDLRGDVLEQIATTCPEIMPYQADPCETPF